VNIDKLDSFYGKGLLYYLAKNRTDDAQIFGHSLLCLRYWLTQDFQNLEYHYNCMMTRNINEDINLFTCARYFAARLFFAEANQSDTSEIIWEANEFYINIKSGKQYNNLSRCFELLFSEALILTGHYAEALIYTTEGCRKNGDGAEFNIDPEIFKSFKLYHAIVLFNLGNEKKGAELFDEINPFEFYFISKQFHTILYLLLGQKLNKIRSVKEQLDYLIEQTGFKKIVALTGVVQ
jgi:hypothetical protein